MTRGKQSFLGGAALLTVTMLVTKAIGALYKIPLGNLLDEQGMNYFYAAYNIYNLLLMVSTAGLPLALSRLVSQAEALGWVNRRRRIVSVAFWLFLLLGLLSSGCSSWPVTWPGGCTTPGRRTPSGCCLRRCCACVWCR